MKRRTFDKLVSFVGLGLAVLLFIFAGLLNFGGGFATENVRTQLANQNIAFPIEAGLPANTKDQLLKWAGQQVVTGEMARDYSDLYILEHMNASAAAVMGKPATYSEVSSEYLAAVRGGSTDVERTAKFPTVRAFLLSSFPILLLSSCPLLFSSPFLLSSSLHLQAVSRAQQGGEAHGNQLANLGGRLQTKTCNLLN
jgi:hypothetical protein